MAKLKATRSTPRSSLDCYEEATSPSVTPTQGLEVHTRPAATSRPPGQSSRRNTGSYSDRQLPTKPPPVYQATAVQSQSPRHRQDIAKRFDDPAVAFSIQTDVDLLESYDVVIRKLEKILEQSAKVHDANIFYLLKTIPGVGKIIAMTLLYEIHDIKRFPEVGDFLPYARLVRGSHTSAGKNYGSPGRWATATSSGPLARSCHCSNAKAPQPKSTSSESKRNKARHEPIRTWRPS